jgi:hypothetical protein
MQICILSNAIRQEAGEKLKIKLNYIKEISVPRSGKIRLVISEIGMCHFAPAEQD